MNDSIPNLRQSTESLGEYNPDVHETMDKVALTIRLKRRARKPFLKVMAAIALVWFGCGLLVFTMIKFATPYTYRDMRLATAEVDNVQVGLSQVNSRTSAWEEVIQIEKYTKLPTTLRLRWPASQGLGVGMSIWLSESPSDSWSTCRIVIPSFHREFIPTKHFR